jgi:hypothetical protein
VVLETSYDWEQVEIPPHPKEQYPSITRQNHNFGPAATQFVFGPSVRECNATISIPAARSQPWQIESLLQVNGLGCARLSLANLRGNSAQSSIRSG